MPIYEYQCDCGREFEAINSIENRHNMVCECGRIARLMMSAWGRVIFAGYTEFVSGSGKVIDRKKVLEPIDTSHIGG